MIKLSVFSFTILVLIACNLQATNNSSPNLKTTVVLSPSISKRDSLEIISFYNTNKNSGLTSKSSGTVSNGKLENGKLVPYFGDNYIYFDKDSYLASRAFTSEKVLNIILDTYAELKKNVPNRYFYLMELSNKNGGKMFPHKTHQNGLSVDFMMPKLKNNAPFYELDTLGKDHYWLDFNDHGEYKEDTSIKVDFNLIAQHILRLEENAKTMGYKIAKVIIKIEYKDDLFSTEFGEKLKKSGIYIVKNLTPLINKLHDDHYHIDFEKIE